MSERGAARRLVDFRDPGAARGWIPVGDRVMGGVSASAFRASGEQSAIFEGEVSLAFGGGFSSVRSGPLSLDLSPYRGLRLSVRGDGKRYKLNLRDDASPDGVVWQHEFAPPAGTWAEIELPLDGFAAHRRGRPAPDAPPLDRARVESLGWVIGDRQEGPFRLEIAWIEGYS